MMNAIKFGERLKYFRRQAGLTQMELSERIDKTPHHITQIERGLSLPSVPLLYDLSQVLGVPMDCFFLDDHEYQRMSQAYKSLVQSACIEKYDQSETIKTAEIVESIRGLLNQPSDEPDLWEKPLKAEPKKKKK